jgi:hypothetical protein
LASKSSRNQREFLIIKEKKMGEVCLDPATGEGVDRSEYERRVKARTKVSEQYRDLLVELKPIWREQIAEAKLDKEKKIATNQLNGLATRPSGQLDRRSNLWPSSQNNRLWQKHLRLKT